ncbi:SlyX family protein [Aquabacterium sp. A08]|uniref:SlyX family protein n=1 Tax=Aquabacterium sp. A08 TaxID=2718532 RepID=UPI0014221AE3|nr:SlyX family protein [Aquabacterium sp. A08]NIC42987.1 SlyX family protein [Aquabacterium sp. A08]
MPATHDDTLDRLTNLEIKASLGDDWLERLNEQVYRQQLQIERLQQEVARLAERQAEAAPPGFRSLRDELPPHY